MKKLLLASLLMMPIVAFGQGWIKLANTTSLVSFAGGGQCPDLSSFTGPGQTACPSGPFAFSGAVWNSYDHCLLIWGGGHGDYGGNETYCMTITGTPTLFRLTDPAPPGYASGPSSGTCNETMPNGTPNIGHTYSGLDMIPAIGANHPKMIHVFRKLAGNGCTSSYLWELDLTTTRVNGGSSQTATWNARSTAVPGYSGAWGAMVYDPVTQTDLMTPVGQCCEILKYEVNSPYTVHNVTPASFNVALRESIALNPAKRLLVAFKYSTNPISGSEAAIDTIEYFDISSLTPTGSEHIADAQWTTSSIDTSCSAAFGTTGGLINSPTITYDPPSGTFTIYPGHDNTVYLFNPGDPFHQGSATDTSVVTPYGTVAPRKCVPATYGSTVGTDYPAPSYVQGQDYAVYKRFAYAPEYDKYVYLPNPNAPAWTFQLQRNAIGIGNTTATCIDQDSDGYGTGPGCLGPDANDGNADVNTPSTWGTNTLTYTTLSSLLVAKGYTAPLHFWYIATTGNDSTCVKDDATKPCLTFNKVRTVGINAGDAVIWRAGTYTSDGVGGSPLNTSPSGTQANPIIYAAYPGERVIFDSAAPATVDLCNSPSAISYVSVDGFVLDNSNVSHLGRAYYTCNSTGMVVRDVEMKNHEDGFFVMEDTQGNTDLLGDRVVSHDAGNHTLYWGAQLHPNSNLTMQNGLFYNVGLTCLQHNGRVTNLSFKGNICYNYQTTGISWEQGVSSSYLTNNLVFNGLAKAFVIYDYPGPASSPGILPYNQINNVIENNTFIIPAKSYLDGSALSSSTNVIGITNIGPYGGLADVASGNTFRNNILYNGANGPGMLFIQRYGTYSCYILGTCNSTEYEFNGDNPGPTIAAPLTWKNNLMYLGSGTTAMRLLNIQATAGTIPTPPTTAPADVDLTYTFSQWQAYNSTTSNNVNNAPTFTSNVSTNWASPELFNFLLATGSYGIDQGTSVGAPATDIRNLTRGIVDIGAYETPNGSAGVTACTLSPSTATIVAGFTQPYSASTCTFTDGSTGDCTSGLSLSSSSPSVATVSGQVATGITPGTTTITGTNQVTCTPTSTLTVNPSPPLPIAVGPGIVFGPGIVIK